jgi:hypothetical protein
MYPHGGAKKAQNERATKLLMDISPCQVRMLKKLGFKSISEMHAKR